MRKPCFRSERGWRRSVLCAGMAAAAIALAVGPVAVGAPEGTLSLDAKAETQKFSWGWIRWLMNGQIDPQAEMTLGTVHIEPHQLNPLHIHPNSAEYVYVLSGTCEQLMGGRWVPMKAGDTLRIPKGIVHQARTKDQACEAMIIYDTPHRQMVPVSKGP